MSRLAGATLVLAGRTGQLLQPLVGAVPGAAIPRPATLADFYAAAGGARVVLVHPDGERWLSPYGWDAVDAQGQRGATFQQTGNAGALTVVLLSRDAAGISGPWGNARDSAELYRGLSIYERHVGRPWGVSTGNTAEDLILSTHPREKGGLTLDRHANVPEVMGGHQVESPWTDWKRPLTEAELGPDRYVHNYDANAQYLSAWGADLGVRDFEHGPRGFDKKVPGYWKIARPDPDDQTEGGLDDWMPLGVDLQLQGNYRLVPRPWHPGREWYTTPTVARFVEVYGIVPDIADAYTWPNKSRYLGAAYEIIRDARTGLLAEQADSAARLALDAVKALYRVETGRLGMGVRKDSSGWKRPDWADTIRATARCNLHRRLTGTPGGRPGLGAAPFAIATDGLLFITDEPDPLVYAESIGLPIGTALGQYSHEGTVAAAIPEQLDVAPTAAAAFKLLRGALARARA